MSKITYEAVPEHYKVFLDGKTVGTIKRVGDDRGYGWRYFAKGSKVPGEPFPTVALCKRSLEG